MHGLILSELKRFTEAKFGKQEWRELLQEAGLGERDYLPDELYPDSEVVALVGGAARRAGADVQTILERFGEFIVPTLISAYRPYIKRGWSTLDVMEHAENIIHRAVRLRDPLAVPPRLRVRRVSFNEVMVTYESDRKMCGLAKGIARGVAEHYGEHIEVNELTCMLKGKPSCTITIKQIHG